MKSQILSNGGGARRKTKAGETLIHIQNRRLTMSNLQKLGGWAGPVHALAYVVSMVVGATLVLPALSAGPERYVAFVADHQAVVYLWNLVAYWVAAIALVLMVLALHERLKTAAPSSAQVAAAFGLIWAALIIGSGNLMLRDTGVIAGLYTKDPAQAAAAWVTLEAVENGIVSGNEVVGSLWVLLVSLTAWRTGELGRALNGFGVVISLAGLLTVIPPLFDSMIMIFGPGMIAWSIWVGIVLLRPQPSARRQASPAAAQEAI
jgi:hypothetical protein